MTTVKTTVRFEVLKRDKFRCVYCGASPTTSMLHVDHVHPRVLGGSNAMHNLVTACADCNIGKGPRPLGPRTFTDLAGFWREKYQALLRGKDEHDEGWTISTNPGVCEEVLDE